MPLDYFQKELETKYGEKKKLIKNYMNFIIMKFLIKNIMASLSPTASNSTKYPGLLDIDDGNTIPFEFQSKYYFIKSAATALKDNDGFNTTIKGAVKNFVNSTSSISTTLKEAVGVQLRIDREKSRQEDA